MGLGKKELLYLPKTGDAIGLNGSKPGAMEKRILNSRDRLIVCSPGIVRAMNLEDELFGQHRVMQALRNSTSKSVHEMRNELLFQLEQFTGGIEAKRDRSIIVAEVKERVLKLAKS
ncbi:MAG: SpoIIE family protein phosphatase [Bdellovibrionales bacterium]